MADLTEERALLPLVTITSHVSEARRLDRRGKVVARAEVHEQVAADGDVVAEWLVEVTGVVGHDDERERSLTRLTAVGMESVDADVATAAADGRGSRSAGTHELPHGPARSDASPRSTASAACSPTWPTPSTPTCSGTIDDVDVEFLHELRVAVRRTRSVLAEGKGVLPADVRRPVPRVVRLAGPDHRRRPRPRRLRHRLGRLRRPAQPRRTEAASTACSRRSRGVAGAAHAELAARLRSDECGELLGSLARVAHRSRRRARRRSPPRAVRGRPHRQGPAHGPHRRAGHHARPPRRERLHDLRKDTKKLRYLLECFGSLFPTKGRKAFVAQLKALQDNLGEHQDAEVHLAQLRELAHDLHARATVDTDALLAMGRLSDQLDRRRAEERADFVERFAAYDTKANRRALDVAAREVSGG